MWGVHTDERAWDELDVDFALGDMIQVSPEPGTIRNGVGSDKSLGLSMGNSLWGVFENLDPPTRTHTSSASVAKQQRLVL